MLVEFFYPGRVEPAALDTYLSQGWFRSSNFLHKSKVICLTGKLCDVLQIRYDLDTLTFSKSQRKLLRKNDAAFRVEIRPHRFSKAKNRLYELAKPKFQGFSHPDLRSFLTGFEENNLFHTMEVAVFDKDKLVAVSLFDRGLFSIANILGLYEPDYKEFSLGTYTLLKEIEYAQLNGCRYTYPGYVLQGNSDFDYKTRFNSVQFRYVSGHWGSYEDLSQSNFPSNRITEINDR
jgi:arginine-tRNA-protein transferase